MLIEENRGADGFTVTAYGGGALEIGGKIYREPVVLKDGTVGPMDGRKPSDLSAADFFQTASTLLSGNERTAYQGHSQAHTLRPSPCNNISVRQAEAVFIHSSPIPCTASSAAIFG